MLALEYSLSDVRQTLCADQQYKADLLPGALVLYHKIVPALYQGAQHTQLTAHTPGLMQTVQVGGSVTFVRQATSSHIYM